MNQGNPNFRHPYHNCRRMKNIDSLVKSSIGSSTEQFLDNRMKIGYVLQN